MRGELGEEERHSTMTRVLSLAAIASLGLSAVAHGQTSQHATAALTDVQHCGALVTRYDTFLNRDGRHGGMRSTDVAANVAAEKCRAGASSDIADLERALKDARVDLPPRTQEGGRRSPLRRRAPFLA